MTEFRVRPLQEGDVPACAMVHRRAFPRFFLAELGPAFLREFYGAFVHDPDAIALVGVDPDGEVRGAVVGTVSPERFFKRLLRRRWHAFAAASLSLVLRRPGTIPRLLRAVTYRGDTAPGRSGALLSSICVAPESGGAGLGRMLLAGFHGALRARGVHSAYLTTDADGNRRANDFYVRAGWRLAGRRTTPQGRVMKVYVWRDEQEDTGAEEPG